MLDEIDPATIADPATRALLLQLLNLVDQQAGQLRAARDEIQRLRDEIARLKGEQGRPKINPQTPPPSGTPGSSAVVRTSPSSVPSARRAREPRQP